MSKRKVSSTTSEVLEDSTNPWLTALESLDGEILSEGETTIRGLMVAIGGDCTYGQAKRKMNKLVVVGKAEFVCQRIMRQSGRAFSRVSVFRLVKK